MLNQPAASISRQASLDKIPPRNLNNHFPEPFLSAVVPWCWYGALELPATIAIKPSSSSYSLASEFILGFIIRNLKFVPMIKACTATGFKGCALNHGLRHYMRVPVVQGNIHWRSSQIRAYLLLSAVGWHQEGPSGHQTPTPILVSDVDWSNSDYWSS